MNKEAVARISINKMLTDSGWRFFDDENGPSNIQLEPNIKIKQNDLDNLGQNFEKTQNGYVDYLLLDENNRPFVIVEAKKDSVHPLTAKEQARKYALSLRVKYIILTNGNIHYFWSLDKGNPEIIKSFPTYQSLVQSKALTSSTDEFVNFQIDKYFIAKSQDPSFENSSEWKSQDDTKMLNYCQQRELRVLRDYQIRAIKSIQKAVMDKKNRFLLEMATGTGKTLTSAGIIKLFIRSDLANRVLFFVDRIELENQAERDLKKYLAKDGIKVSVYKQSKDDWKSSDVIISTIQSFSYSNNFKTDFRPSDFDLIISDEAHRSLGPSNRSIFEYFLGYKLGLTATPKNYLKGVDFAETDPREIEKRILMDTYHIFGCDSGSPTFSYTLNDGVSDGILVNPIIIDARSDITTELLSDQGIVIDIDNDNFEVTVSKKGENSKKIFTEKNYEKTFFSSSTNSVFCKTFLDNAEKDPFTNEIGKSIIFCVNIEHARKVTEILNDFADKEFPGKYSSDFAIQITSNIPDSQMMTINFSNNNLSGHSKWLDDYLTSKSRVAITVGMMTTGYDCTDILNIAFMRPVFSPSSFIQMKGRGTRLHNFKHDQESIKKTHFKLFDFFAICEYFEKDFKYDEKLKLPKISSQTGFDGVVEETIIDSVINQGSDLLKTLKEEVISYEGMKIDRKFFESFEDKVSNDPVVKKFIEQNNESGLEFYLQNNVFNKPTEFFTVKKLERSLGLDRKLTLKEIVLNLLGKIKGYKSKTELLEDEFQNFLLLFNEDLTEHSDKLHSIQVLFQAYLIDPKIRVAIKEGKFQEVLNSQIGNDLRKIRDVSIKGERFLIFLKDYVTYNNINCEQFN